MNAHKCDMCTFLHYLVVSWKEGILLHVIATNVASDEKWHCTVFCAITLHTAHFGSNIASLHFLQQCVFVQNLVFIFIISGKFVEERRRRKRKVEVEK